MRVFDLKSGEVSRHLTGNSAHSGPITSLVSKDNTIFASGGVDGVAKLFSTQSGKTVANFDCGSTIENEEGDITSNTAVEAMVFSQNEQNLLVTGTLDGVIHVWDISLQVSCYITNETRQNNSFSLPGFQNVVFSRKWHCENGLAE